MTKGNYQRRYLRAPYREEIVYSDGETVLKASTLNVSEDGLLIDFLPSFPTSDEVNIIFPLRALPVLKSMSSEKLQAFSLELVETNIIRARARMVRRDQLSQDLENIFKSRFGLNFTLISADDQKKIENYVSAFSSNLVYLQTLVDSYNTDEETRKRVRILAKILGYKGGEKISKLRIDITHDYKSLQWI